MSALLDEVIQRADLRVVRADDTDRRRCAFDALWPAQVFTVVGSEADLRAWLDLAEEDVEDLWPGREPEEGALSLLAIALEAALRVRAAPPIVVRASAGRWVVEPDEPPPSHGGLGSDQLEWRADPR